MSDLVKNHIFGFPIRQHICLQVKGAMYGCISGLCQSLPELCENYVSKMAPIVFHNLDEKDPVICANLWEATLSLVNYLPVSFSAEVGVFDLHYEEKK